MNAKTIPSKYFHYHIGFRYYILSGVLQDTRRNCVVLDYKQGNQDTVATPQKEEGCYKPDSRADTKIVS